MTITTDVENTSGFADVIQGPWLMEQMEAQARHVGTRMVEDIITSIDTSQRPFHLKRRYRRRLLCRRCYCCYGSSS